MQRNIFNEYILIINDTIIYSTLPGKPNLVFTKQNKGETQDDKSEAGKSTLTQNIDIINQTNPGQATISGVTTYDINISNNPYKLFVCQTQIENKNWYVCGLVRAELIDQAKKGMAPWVLLLIFMVLALIILGLPFIKLKVMSPTEQLTSGNLINSAISLFLGTSFIFLFIFFISNAYWYRIQNESRLEKLATEINDSLRKEISNSWHQLDVYDKIGVARTKLNKDLPDSTNVLNENALKPLSYQYFDYSFYMDSLGDQKGILTPFSIRDKPTNLSNRDYFKKPDEWIFPGNDTCRFRMESIVSVTSGVVKAALSKRSDLKNMVIAMTGRFYSVIDPIMPEEYKFCIIDGNGLVWFHSDKLRNLRENLITECNENANLSAAIYANATKILNVYYYDEPYRIRIEPLAPMPLYLVTMYDKRAEYDYQVQVLMLTLLLFSALVFFIIIQTVTLFFFKRFVRNRGLKNLIMDFIGAKEEHSKIYVVMSVVMVLTALLYYLLIGPVNILFPLISALAMLSILFPYLNYAINGFTLKSPSRNLFALTNLVFLILINIEAIRFISERDLYKMWIFQGSIIVLLVIGYAVLKRDFTLQHKKYNITFYVCFLMGLLLVYSVAPAIKFFEASVSHEIIRGIKHDQLELSRLRESRNAQLSKYYILLEQNHKLDPSVIPVFEHRMSRGIYAKFVNSTFYIGGKTYWEEMDTKCKDFIDKNEVSDERGGEFIINNFRPVYDRTSIETKYLEDDSLLNGNQTWKLCKDSIVFNYSSISEKYASLKPVSCRIVTGFQRPDIFNPLIAFDSTGKWFLFQKYEIIFILFLLIVIYGIYRLIIFGTRKLFGISILEMHTEYNFGNSVSERLASGHPVIVIGSPSVSPVAFIKRQLKGYYKLISFDLLTQNSGFSDLKPASDKDVLIIENFAYDYSSPQSFVLQLKEINEKISKKYRMVIVGTVSPYLIQDYLQQKLKPDTADKEKSKEKPAEETEMWEQLITSFNNILSKMNVIFAPEKYDERILQPDCKDMDNTGFNDDEKVKLNEDLRRFICCEIGASTYLYRYADELTDFCKKLETAGLHEQIIKDRIILRIMDLSKLYYDNILNSCSPMERFVLSDMAQDMIVNSKNQSIVLLLIHRGLFVNTGFAIRFMNESFRKHVLLSFTPGEKERLKAKLGDSGMSWQGYKLVLILVMIGLFSFLFIANRSILDNLNKLFIVIGGGTVLITNLTGFLTRKETGNTK